MTKNPLFHNAPSVGSVTKKILAINPNLTAQEVIRVVKQATLTQAQAWGGPDGAFAGDFASAEVIDETKALNLARATLNQQLTPQRELA